MDSARALVSVDALPSFVTVAAFEKRTMRAAFGEKWPIATIQRPGHDSGGSLCAKEVPNWRGNPAIS